jgi:hypothetical protein
LDFCDKPKNTIDPYERYMQQQKQQSQVAEPRRERTNQMVPEMSFENVDRQ